MTARSRPPGQSPFESSNSAHTARLSSLQPSVPDCDKLHSFTLMLPARHTAALITRIAIRVPLASSPHPLSVRALSLRRSSLTTPSPLTSSPSSPSRNMASFLKGLCQPISTPDTRTTRIHCTSRLIPLPLSSVLVQSPHPQPLPPPPPPPLPPPHSVSRTTTTARSSHLSSTPSPAKPTQSDQAQAHCCITRRPARTRV